MIEKYCTERARDDRSINTVEDIERIETDAWTDLFAAAPTDFAKNFGLSVTRMDDHILFAVKKSPSTLYNRSSVIGILQSLDEAALGEATRWLREHCGPTWAIPIAPGAQPSELPALLVKNGLTPMKPDTAKFWRDATALSQAVECQYEVRLATEEHAADFGFTISQGFAMHEGFAIWRAALCGRRHWRTYVVYDGLEPAGAGAMYIRDNLAWLGMTTTLPSYRGKGVQRALLTRRINDAADLGAKLLTIETLHAGADEPQNASYRNVIRAGFSIAYLRRQYTAQ